MNKTNNTKSKVDKCPSTITQENKINDVPNSCILKTKHELKNGLVNGVVNGPKKNIKTKKKQNADVNVTNELISDCRQIDNIKSSTNLLEDQSEQSTVAISVSKKIKSSKKKKCKMGKLDSNDNISTSSSCDTAFPAITEVMKTSDICLKERGMERIIPDDEMASCSSFLSIPDDSGISSNLDLDLANTLKDMKLDEAVESSKREDGVRLVKDGKKIEFIQYENELQMPMIMKIIQKDLSEPYSIYTYRYFIHNWPKLCFLAMCEDECVGAIVCKLDIHRKVIKRGYIAMLAVDKNFRNLRIGSNLVQMAINEMMLGDADEVVLETEVTNKNALKLYEKLGFVRDKRLFRYYLNGVDALRLKLWLR